MAVEKIDKEGGDNLKEEMRKRGRYRRKKREGGKV